MKSGYLSFNIDQDDINVYQKMSIRNTLKAIDGEDYYVATVISLLFGVFVAGIYVIVAALQNLAIFPSPFIQIALGVSLSVFIAFLMMCWIGGMCVAVLPKSSTDGIRVETWKDLLGKDKDFDAKILDWISLHNTLRTKENTRKVIDKLNSSLEDYEKLINEEIKTTKEEKVKLAGEIDVMAVSLLLDKK